MQFEVVDDLKAHPEGRKLQWTERKFKIYMPRWTKTLEALWLSDLVSLFFNLKSSLWCCRCRWFLIGFFCLECWWVGNIFVHYFSEKLCLHHCLFSFIRVLQCCVALQHIWIDRTRSLLIYFGHMSIFSYFLKFKYRE